jgi:chromosome segregation protein
VGTRRADAEAEIEQLAEQGAAAEERPDAGRPARRPAAGPARAGRRLRAAQARANEQRGAVAQVQQQIQVLAAEQRSIDEQARQLGARRDRLGADRMLAAPDEQRLANLQAQLAEAQEAAEAEARLHELQDSVPQLDEARAAQQAVNAEAARQADLSARMEASRRCRKGQTDGKLKPWLAKHGLDGLQGLWSRMHIEPGWETRWKPRCASAWRRWKSAAWTWCAPSRPMRRPPSWPSTRRRRCLTRRPPPAAPGRLLRLHDAGLKALLADWLAGCHGAQPGRRAGRAPSCRAARRSRAQRPRVTAHGVAFYAPDSEQAGLLARAQEIENLDKQLRAQALIGEEARSALVRAEAAYSDASQRLVATRREASEAQRRARPAGRDPAPGPAGRAAARAASRSTATWPRSTPRSRRCRSGA